MDQPSVPDVPRIDGKVVGKAIRDTVRPLLKEAGFAESLNTERDEALRLVGAALNPANSTA